MTNDEMNGAINRKANIGENREIANGSDLKNAEQDSLFFGELPKGWILKKFGDILSEPVRNGVYKKKEFHGRGQKIINMGELFAYNFISNQEMKRVELNPNEISKSIVQDGDLLFARRSLVLEGSGKCSLVVHPSENLTFESSIIRARPDRTQADSKFYYYLFQSRLGRALMASIATQTAVSGITGSNLMQLKMPQPPLLEQRKIASILSAYDDLIENNTRRIKILEEMAQALYREWFVKFRFPGHEKVGMVESEMGMVPEGWEVKKVKDILKKLKAGNVYTENVVTKTGNVPVIDQSLDSFLGFHNNNPDHMATLENPIMIFGDHTCKMQLMVEPFSIGPNVVPFRSQNETPILYLYFLVRNLVETKEYKRHWTELTNKTVVLTSNEYAMRFTCITKPLFEQIDSLIRKNLNLRRTRDLLLPKLISGEVDVEKLDINIPTEAV